MVEAAQARARLTRRRGPRASGWTPLPSSAPSSHAPFRPTPAQAYCLKTDENGVSLYEHLAEVLQSIDLKDPNALAEFESRSLDIKAARFKPSVGVRAVAPEIEDLTTKVKPLCTHPLTSLTAHRSPVTALTGLHRPVRRA